MFTVNGVAKQIVAAYLSAGVFSECGASSLNVTSCNDQAWRSQMCFNIAISEFIRMGHIFATMAKWIFKYNEDSKRPLKLKKS